MGSSDRKFKMGFIIRIVELNKLFRISSVFHADMGWCLHKSNSSKEIYKQFHYSILNSEHFDSKVRRGCQRMDISILMFSECGFYREIHALTTNLVATSSFRVDMSTNSKQNWVNGTVCLHCKNCKFKLFLRELIQLTSFSMKCDHPFRVL